MENEFQPNPSKKAQEVILSRKVNNVLHPLLIFNNVRCRSNTFSKTFGNAS